MNAAISRQSAALECHYGTCSDLPTRHDADGDSDPGGLLMRSQETRQFLTYLAVSVFALLVDVTVLYLLAERLSLNAPLAGALAYGAGLVVHYALAVSHVFGFRRFGRRPATEFVLYACTGIIGIGVSYLILLVGMGLGASLWSSKSVAVAISFTLTYAVRRWFLFRGKRGFKQQGLR